MITVLEKISDSPRLDSPAAPSISITGLGLVTPLGLSAWETFRALLAGKTIADRAVIPPDSDRPSPKWLGREDDAISLVRRVGSVSTAQHSATDPSVALAESAARQALTSANIPESDWPNIPCLIGTSKGAVHAWTRAALRASNRQPLSTDDALAVALGPTGYLAHHLRHRLNLGPTRSVVAACASSLTALHVARQTLLAPDSGWLGQSLRRPSQTANGEVTSGGRILVVTSESALLPMFIHSYHRLGVLPPLTPQHYRCLPLDQHRTGFIPAEQSAAVLLERVPAPDSQAASTNATSFNPRTSFSQTSNLKPQTFLLSTAIASESHHLIHSSPTMPALERLARQLFSHHPIDAIHPHAPGTIDNDASELAAYARALSDPNPRPQTPDPSPYLYAPKGALGHGLGAAGLVSLVVACLCAKSRRLPPMPWLQHPINSPLLLKPQTSDLKPSSSTHAIFSSGFGGHVAGALIHATHT